MGSQDFKKPRWIIISDMFGDTQSLWFTKYIEALSPYVHIQVYDSRVLANISVEQKDQSCLHSLFVDSALDTAVNALQVLEGGWVSILGFSIGGTIGWKAALQGLKLEHLCLVCSTRIRKEIQKPICRTIDCFFGQQDPYIPQQHWFDQMELERVKLFDNADHSLYKQDFYMQWICNHIIALISEKKDLT